MRRLMLVSAACAMMLYLFEPQSARSSALGIGSNWGTAAIRHDLPLLLASNGIDPDQITIDWVVSDHEDAVAEWRTPGQLRGITVLHLTEGQWWWRAGAAMMPNREGWTKLAPPGHEISNCGSPDHPPTAQQLLALGYVDEALMLALVRRLPTTQTSQSRRPLVLTLCDTFSIGSVGGGYDASFEPFACGGNFLIAGRRPASPNPLEANGLRTYYKFDLTAQPWCGKDKDVAAVVPMDGHSTVRFSVWFPYVLNPRVDYSLVLSGVSPAFAPVRGTLQNNILTFELPLFSEAAAETANGSIVGQDLK